MTWRLSRHQRKTVGHSRDLSQKRRHVVVYVVVVVVVVGVPCDES